MNPKPNNRDAGELSFKDHIFLLYFFIYKERLTTVISVQCIVRRVVQVYFL